MKSLKKLLILGLIGIGVCGTSYGYYPNIAEAKTIAMRLDTLEIDDASISEITNYIAALITELHDNGISEKDLKMVRNMLIDACIDPISVRTESCLVGRLLGYDMATSNNPTLKSTIEAMSLCSKMAAKACINKLEHYAMRIKELIEKQEKQHTEL